MEAGYAAPVGIMRQLNGHPADKVETRLLLIRHGHVITNGGDLAAPMTGWTDVPLSPRGRRQVAELRDFLARGRRFDGIYSSPLSRASTTAKSLADAQLGELRLCPGLMEINCGEADGLPLGEVQLRFPHLWDENLRQASAEFRWPGGESYRELRKRALTALREIAGDHPGGFVAVVTHAGVISQILGSIHGLSPACWSSFRPGNGSISELLWRGDHGQLLRFDRRDHLSERD
jgi:broad specificity phosphatase PhoE